MKGNVVGDPRPIGMRDRCDDQYHSVFRFSNISFSFPLVLCAFSLCLNKHSNYQLSSSSWTGAAAGSSKGGTSSKMALITLLRAFSALMCFGGIGSVESARDSLKKRFPGTRNCLSMEYRALVPEEMNTSR